MTISSTRLSAALNRRGSLCFSMWFLLLTYGATARAPDKMAFQNSM